MPCCQESLWRWIDTFAAMARELHTTARAALAKFKSHFKFEKDKRLFNTNFLSAHSEVKQEGLVFLYQVFVLREYFASLVEPKDFLVWLIFQKRLVTGNGTWPTRFTNDQSQRIRDNGARAGPKRG